MPLISFLYPTRDRPQILEYTMKAISMLDYQDFEVIISDNSKNQSAYSVLQKYKHDKRFKYYWTKGNYSMAENYNYALNQATGIYVSAQTDKSFLKIAALTAIKDLLLQEDLDVLNWQENSFTFIDEDNTLEKGYFKQDVPKSEYHSYDPKEELIYLTSFEKHRALDNAHYFRGKIFFGCVKRELINEISKQFTFFDIYAPDYTSRVLILSHANKCLEITSPLQSSFTSKTSNGAKCSTYPDAAFRFFNESDGCFNVNKYFPVKGLYTSTQNYIAGDYYRILCNLESDISINTFNLSKTILRDLFQVKWPSLKLMINHFNLYFIYIKKFSLTSYLQLIFYYLPIIFFICKKVLLKKLIWSLIHKIMLKSKLQSGKNILFSSFIYFDSFEECHKAMNKIYIEDAGLTKLI